MNRKIRIPVLLLVMILTLSIVPLPAYADPADPGDGKDAEYTITTSVPSIMMEEGATYELQVQVTPEKEDAQFVWKSADDKIVTADEKGRLTAVGAGETTVTVNLKDTQASAEVKVTVTEKSPEEIPLADVVLKESSITVTAKETVQLDYTCTPENTTESPQWSSADEKIATVDEKGNVTGVGVGETTVTAGWKDKTVSCKVRVLFSDVSEEEYYYKPVYWALENGITAGITPETFRPEKFCTRGQIMTFLWRINGSPEPDLSNNPFQDVTADHYFYKPVLWAYQSGMTSGTSATTFSPEAYCSRGQVVQFIWGCQKNKETRTVAFTDVSKSAYFYHAVKWAYHQGITAGTSRTTFGPYEACTRGQIVTFLYQCRESGVDIYDKDKVAAFDDKAAHVLDQVGWDLRAAFNWAAGLTYFGHNSQMPSDESPGIQWFSDYGFDHHKGNCYVMACCFYRMAKMLGYEVYPISGYVPSARGGMTPHSWTEVIENGKTYVYDPNFTNETGRNGYRITYGQSGTWRYADYHRMTK